MREELSVDARVGPPVGAVYGAWFDGEGNPLVTLFYRCETDERTVTLNHEHDDAEWISPATAGERLVDTLGVRASRMLDRAVALGDLDREDATVASAPFAARADPYDGTEVETAAMLEYLRGTGEHSGGTPERGRLNWATPEQCVAVLSVMMPTEETDAARGQTSRTPVPWVAGVGVGAASGRTVK